MAERSLENPPRPAVSDPGRFAARLPPAAAIAALCRAGRLSASRCRPIRSPNARRCPIRASPIRSALRYPRHRAAKTPSPPLAPETLVLQQPAAVARRPRREHAGAHGAGRRSARRPPVRVHAAGRDAQRLSRTARGRRSDRGRTRPAGPRRRLCAAARSAAQRPQGDARPRRHRGQHSSGGVVARSGRDHARRSTRKRICRGSAPTNS